MSKEATKNSSVEIRLSEANTDIALLSQTRCYIGNWDDAPDFMQDNEYIKRGYRINFNTIGRVLKSLFKLHNETTNIWSHLLAAILFTSFTVYIGGWISFTNGPGINSFASFFNSSHPIYRTTNGNLLKPFTTSKETTLNLEVHAE
jgi:hypothetical protein